MRNNYVYFIIASFIMMLCFSCHPNNSGNPDVVSSSHEDRLSVLHPKINQINKESIDVYIPGLNGVPFPQKIAAGKPIVRSAIGIHQITPGVSFLSSESSGKEPVLSSKPIVIVVKPESLKTYTLGKDTKIPTAYQIESPIQIDSVKNSYSIQFGDTIFQAVKIQYPQPILREALLPRYKNDALYNIQYLDVEQGLSFSNVWSIIQDKRSNLWFGTDGVGVSRYDGKYFTNYSKREGLSDDIIRSMLEDQDGNIWFGTWAGGVDKYDGKTFTHYTKKEGFCNDVVRAMIQDKKGNIWFATLGSGVFKFDGKLLTKYTKEQGLSNDSLLSVLEDKNGTLWFGTWGNGVNKFDGHTITCYTEKDGFPSKAVRAILEDKQGNLWFGTDGAGICKYDGNRTEALEKGETFPKSEINDLLSINGKFQKTFTKYGLSLGLNNYTCYCIILDNEGNPWFGTDGGVYNYDGTSFTHFSEKEGLNNNHIRASIRDNAGNLWFGTHGGGVCEYVPRSFKHFTEKEGLSSRLVTSMLEDKDHNLWFGTWDSGVCKYDGTNFISYSQKEGLCNNTVRSIVQDKFGNYWFATEDGGVSKFDGKYFYNYTDKQGLGKNRVRKILEDKHGNLWFGTSEGGIVKYDGNRIKDLENGVVMSEDEKSDFQKVNGKYRESLVRYTTKDGLADDNVWDLMEDKDGNIWMGTFGGGICKFDGHSFVSYSVKEGLGSSEVRSIIIDDIGIIWAGTNGGGLSRFDGRSFTTFTKKDGINDNYVRSLLKDRNGGIWIGTISGLTYMRNGSGTGDSRRNIQLFDFGLQDGLKGIEFYPNSILLDSKNQLWAGSGKALNTIDLNVFELQGTKPVVQLNNLRVADNFIDFNIYNRNTDIHKLNFTNVAAFYNYPINLELPYNQNYLNFYFSASDWSAPEKIRYQYKLEGLDRDWSKATSNSFADYRNIPYGKYTFKIRALGFTGLVSDTFEYTFKIHPPWWHTWWFRACFSIFILVIMVGFYYYRMNSLIRQRENLELKVAERTNDLKMANTELEEQQKEILEKNEEIIQQAENLKYSRDQLVLINEHLLSQKKELKKALKKLKRAQLQLIQSERHASIGILSSGIAHEINNPLNFIQGGIVAIEKYINNNLEGHTKYLSPLVNIINAGINRATEIIISLENFNKKSNLKADNCDIHGIINNCLIILQNRTKSKIEIQKEFTADPYQLTANISDLHQAILNILINAEESIASEGIISIFTHVVKQKMEIIIVDTGCGISKENLPKIIDPFFTTKDPGKGTGFGLSIAYNIIEEHQGTLEFQSEPGVGTKVIINIPMS
jgi:ligand-binding sensor domain-containing protein/signal transduction histidine kinase